MAFLINQKDCSASALRGTGTKGCKIAFGYILQFVFTRKGLRLNPATDDFNQTKINELVRAGDMIIMPTHTFTPQPEAQVYQTLADGTKEFVRNGIFEALAAYTNKSICFGNALNDLALSDWDLWMVDSNNVIYFHELASGEIKGFSTKLVRKDAVVFNDGSNTSAYNLLVGFDTAGTNALFGNVGYKDVSDIGFLDLEGINDTELSLGAAAPSGTAIEIAAKISCDGSTDVLGMEANFRATDSTGAVTFGTATFANGVYTFAPATALAPGNYLIDLYDQANSSEVVTDSENVFYKSNDLAVTIP